MILILTITNLLTLALLLFLRHRYGRLLKYTRHSDQERIALALENSELKEEREYISFRIGPEN
jgi:hypothetical protein